MLHLTNSSNKVPAYWYEKMDDKMSWHEFMRQSINHFRQKHEYFPVFITMNPTDKFKAFGKARGVDYRNNKIQVNEDKMMLHLHIGLHY